MLLGCFLGSQIVENGEVSCPDCFSVVNLIGIERKHITPHYLC